MNYMNSVKAFTLAIEKGNFTNAADVLGITPSMLARQIRELETYLDVKLINRTTRKQGLTVAGECYYKYCQDIILAATRGEEALAQLKDEITGNIRVSAPVAFGNKILTKLIARFLCKYPAVNIELELSDRRVDMIAENYQIAIRIGNVLDDGVVALSLPSYDMVLVASPEYLKTHNNPKTPQDLTEHNCICFTQWNSNKYWTMEKDSQVYSIPISPRFICNTGESIRQAALNGLGIALNSTVMLQDDIDAGRLVKVLPTYSIASHEMNLLRTPNSSVHPAIMTFIQFLRTELIDTDISTIPS